MKRKPLVALLALAALPAAVIAATAIGAGAGTSAAGTRASAVNYARLADTANSGIDVIGTALDCNTVSVGGINPDPGSTATITVTGDGQTSSVASTNATISQKFSGMQPSTKYTVSMYSGTESYTFYVTTPAC